MRNFVIIDNFVQSAAPYIFSIYIILMIYLFIIISVKDKRKNNIAKAKFEKSVDTLLSSDCESISYRKLLRIGKGLGLKDFKVHSLTSEIYANRFSDKGAEKLENVLDDIDNIDPYNSLPEDLKLALIQVEKQMKIIDTDSNELIIQPIKSHLVKYSELIEERDGLKKKTKINSLITIVSAIVGVFGLALTLTLSSPSISDIEHVVNKSLEKQNSQLKNASDEKVATHIDAGS